MSIVNLKRNYICLPHERIRAAAEKSGSAWNNKNDEGLESSPNKVDNVHLNKKTIWEKHNQAWKVYQCS